MSIEELIDQHVPLAVVAALLLQAGTAVWWAATKDSDDRFEQQRVHSLEIEVEQTRDGQAQMIERLARIEERVNAELFMLEQLEKRLGTVRK
jgi:hypothetical protein